MTKKNGLKRTARARQATYGGRFMHHRRVVEGPSASGSEPATMAIAPATLIEHARREVPDEIAEAANRNRSASTVYVYVTADPSDPVGATFIATRLAQEKGTTVSAELTFVHATAKNSTSRKEASSFAELMTLEDFMRLLNATVPPERVDVSVQLLARFSAPPPEGDVHVLAVAAGGLTPASVSAVHRCHCGHPLADHKDNGAGACTFLGVPGHRPFLGLPPELAAQARAQGIPMECPCGGPPVFYDNKGSRFVPHPRGASRKAGGAR